MAINSDSEFDVVVIEPDAVSTPVSGSTVHRFPMPRLERQCQSEHDTDSASASASSSSSVFNPRRRSTVWTFFSVRDQSKRDWVTCDICGIEDSKGLVKTKDSSTSNLFGHLKVHHPTQYSEVATVCTNGNKSKSKLQKRSS